MELAQNLGENIIRVVFEIQATSCNTASQLGDLDVSLDSIALLSSILYLLKSLLKVEVNI